MITLDTGCNKLEIEIIVLRLFWKESCGSDSFFFTNRAICDNINSGKGVITNG